MQVSPLTSPVAGIPQSTGVMRALATQRTQDATPTAKDMTIPLSPGAAFFMAQHKPNQVGFDVQTLLLLQG